MTAPSPVEMPGAKCGRGNGLYRCVRKAGHGGNCSMQRRTDVDLAEDDGQLAPAELAPGEPALADVLAATSLVTSDAKWTIPTPAEVRIATPAEPMPPRWASPHAIADQLEVAARSLRWSGSTALTGAEQRHARAIARSIVERVDRELTATTS